jgi:hypothetical protein
VNDWIVPFGITEQQGAVLVEGVLIEAEGHMAWFWSDDERVTWVECGCPRGGKWEHHGLDAHAVVDAWGEHHA